LGWVDHSKDMSKCSSNSWEVQLWPSVSFKLDSRWGWPRWWWWWWWYVMMATVWERWKIAEREECEMPSGKAAFLALDWVRNSKPWKLLKLAMVSYGLLFFRARNVECHELQPIGAQVSSPSALRRMSTKPMRRGLLTHEAFGWLISLSHFCWGLSPIHQTYSKFISASSGKKAFVISRVYTCKAAGVELHDENIQHMIPRGEVQTKSRSIHCLGV